ncbi:MAG TPA: hypothetical protein EYP10_15125 [Armatimonadetes bacterium]|nr:hypothetical protein [Armatimonadota bacterium]
MTSQELMQKLKEGLGEKVLECWEPRDARIFMRVARDDIIPACDFAFNALKARYITTCATDDRQRTGKFTVMHIFGFDEDKLFLSVRTEVDPDDPVLPSITPLIPGAEWAEREQQDLIGVKFEGHPDPRRLILPDDWPVGVHPLRKDFPYNHRPEPDPNGRMPLKEPPEGTTVVAVGPFFPVLEEPAYFRLFVDSETVVGCDYRGFYSHRGIEKLGDSKLTYNQIPFLAERI